MRIHEAISYLEKIKMEYDCSYEEDALNMAIKSLEAWEEVKQDLYKFARDSFDAECAECYRIALHCVEEHLKEVENDGM